MLRTILIFGLAAGLVVTLPMDVVIAGGAPGFASGSMLFGYAMMLLALSLVFVGVKRYRDRALGGVIRFLPALLMGLGISVVAGVIYTLGWEVTLAATHYTFADSYAAGMVHAAQAKGASPAAIARAVQAGNEFKAQYANPLYRLPMTFIEIFPVGVLVSLIAAGLLRNSRFLPARAAA